MTHDPTQRFSSRVADYVRCRPSYPTDIVNLLARECGLTPNSRIADIGSGTGLLARLFLDFGCEVVGIEPNSGMRQAGERMLADQTRFLSIDGRAESTTLPACSVDVVTAAQAFHWFEPEQTRAEFLRILRPPNWVVLVWNERLRAPGFMTAYEDLVARFGPEREYVAAQELTQFFGAAGWRMEKLPNQQLFDLDGLRGRFLSSSYAPLPATPGYVSAMEELERIFAEREAEGVVTMLYRTEVYFGKLQA